MINFPALLSASRRKLFSEKARHHGERMEREIGEDRVQTSAHPLLILEDCMGGSIHTPSQFPRWSRRGRETDDRGDVPQ